jgi:hypothetical protein
LLSVLASGVLYHAASRIVFSEHNSKLSSSLSATIETIMPSTHPTTHWYDPEVSNWLNILCDSGHVDTLNVSKEMLQDCDPFCEVWLLP